MKRFIYYILFATILTFTQCQYSYTQSPTQIKKKCPNSSIYAVTNISSVGNISVQPCVGRSTIFTQTVDFTDATVIGLPSVTSPLTTKGDLWGFSTLNARVPVGANGTVLTADSTNPLGVTWAAAASGITGSGTLNFIPRFTAASVIGNTPFSWNGTQYVFNNTALNSNFRMELTPVNGNGIFNVRDFVTGDGISYSQTTGRLDFNAFGVASANGRIDNGSGTIDFQLTNGSNSAIHLESNIVDFTAGTAVVINGGVLKINNDCAGVVRLNGSGEFDLTAKTCWNLTSGTTVVLLTGITSTGILTVNGGLISSSVGAADGSADVNYWIIDTP